MTVRRRLGDAVGADRPARADTVLHHDGLLEALLQLLGNGRPIASTPPPGAIGTTSVIGRVDDGAGVCACVAEPSATHAKATMIVGNMRIVFLPERDSVRS